MFFARAYRLFAYRGSMREEAQIEARNNEQPQPAAISSAPSRTPPPQSGGETWVSPEQMLALYNDPMMEVR